MFQTIEGKRDPVVPEGGHHGHGGQPVLASRLSRIAAAFGCPGIVELSLWIGPLAAPPGPGTPAVEEGP
jgi:hypothetical protein